MSEPSSQLTLSIGDRVVYPNQGICRVVAVDEKEVAGQRLTFVTLNREQDGAVVMVPRAKIQSIGVRRVSGAEEVQRIFDFLRAEADEATQDWKIRAKTNSDRMAQGGLLGMAEVVKGLQTLSELRPLPAKERALYDNARHLLVNELAVALGIAACDAEDSIDLILAPPGRARPKPTAKLRLGPDGEPLELGDDLMGLDEDVEDQDEASEEDDDVKKAPLSDDDETLAVGKALKPEDLEVGTDEPSVTKKRGRPPKAKAAPATEGADGSDPAPPKRRGRPPKAKPEGEAAAIEAAPKKRGRPPKAATEAKKK